ncbi:uncharacterized protein LOC110037154 isoform X2 [Phalaenopsis equestris]|nr:uncharacterized protein LOC110037154 isoform X2 [Phalaenopsis equestris]XP_020597405.1 uncharacterized protein LOC110037154 isoform X2 [Phalaenopsis equestris]XP_020597413.1 uncharacterized protein LOC110037154 isoform X2 [Phalaenopsis equestris]XP_020597420.1 uncharacterized protein LOC110037154 isoform X2 [Phalaenopsis equestris]XP_020597429.1 uncharacterized protein LOC110037154 isoform X2 [Phalaenopsis equestris]
MDLDILSESENTFVAGPRSKIEISDRYNRKKAEERVVYAEERDKKWRHSSSYGLTDNDSNGSSMYYPANSDQKSLPSRSIGMVVKDSEVLKRGSTYQSSEEVRRMQVVKDRRTVKQDRRDEAFLSFKVIKSPPRGSSREFVYFPEPTKNALVSLPLDPDSLSLGNNKLFPTENMEFLDLSFRDFLEDRSKISISCSNANADPAGSSPANKLLEKRLQSKEISSLAGKEAPEFVQKLRVKETKSGALQLCSAGVDASIIYEREYISILPKSFSAKAGTPDRRYYSAREMLKSSPKTRFSPFKKMLDPILKSNAWRNPSLLEPETSSSTAFDAPSLSRHKFFPKSLLNDFSRATQKIENDKVPNGSANVIKTANSPVHLHALLRWECNHGASFYEFSVKDPEDVLRAKTWKTENAFNWVYTFHCLKKKSNSQNNKTKESHDQLSLMIGQMQVSCYLCPEITNAGSFDNSAITEFILYDIAHARKNNAVERSHFPSNSNQTAVFTVADSLCAESSLESSSLIKAEDFQSPVSCNSSNFESELSTAFPWATTELQPNLEIAAIVIQIPFSKKDALKNFQAGDKYKCSAADLRVSDDNCPSPVYMKVVAPTGRHGLPNSEEVGPSSLLDRWRFGGGCDCGGWDMGCPILVFETVSNDNVASITGTQGSILLFVKGKKEKVPALSITANGKGYYAVDFHAQLSSLQAFSICIAILQGFEASSAIGQDNDKHKPYSNSLKLLLEEEVRDIIEAVSEKKRQTNTRVKQVPPSFFLDSPFSPMGRV